MAQKIIEELKIPWVTLLSMDSFYKVRRYILNMPSPTRPHSELYIKVLNDQQHEQAADNQYNFDHPDAFDFDLLIETMKKLKEGKKVEVPIYNFVSHRRDDRSVSMSVHACH